MFRILTILLFPLFLTGQDNTIDSLKLALKNAKHDTTRCNVLNAMIEAESDDAIWPKYNEQLKNIAEANLKLIPSTHPFYTLFNKHLANSLNNIGYLYQSQGDISKALIHYGKSLKIQQEIGDRAGIAGSLNNMGAIYKNQGDIPKALEYYNKSLKIQEEMGDKSGIAYSLNNIGTIYYNQGDILKALQYYINSMKLREEIRDQYGIATSLNNLGVIYQDQGDIPKALEYYSKSLKIEEEIGDKAGIANSLNNIAFIYNDQGDVLKALEYYGKSLKIQEEIGNKNGIANSLNNIGVLYQDQGDPSVTSSKEDALRTGILKALEYYGKSLKIREEMGDKAGIAYSLNNIGVIYQDHGDPSVTSSREDAIRAGFPKALQYFSKSLKIKEEIGDKAGIATTLNNIGTIWLKQKRYSKAVEYYNQSMKVSKELGYPEDIRNAAQSLYEVYKITGNHQLALENYGLFIQMRDSINNDVTRKASIKQQLKHEYETKAAADSVAHAKESEIKNAELAKQSAEIKAKKNQQYALFGGLALFMLFAGFMFNRWKVTQKQKTVIELQKSEVEKQKKLVEEKQKEILDSIRYAKRIQLAQIPSPRLILILLSKTKK